ncbi:hypothetical protein [Streptomyces griseosporeus]|uniref:hypothetical protein n=1 Tax=Streptomyces griseosporeus TaxID=1910 RepID=UPI003701C693
MNTERPDNDDAAAETTEGAAGKDTPREASGARAEESASGARGQESASEARAQESASGGHVEESGTRSARRRSPVVVASVVAAVLLVGGGGAYLTASASGGSGGDSGSGAPGGDGSPAPLVLDGYSEGGGTGGTGGTNGIAPGEPNPYGVAYQAAGPLPDGPGSAPVYWAKGEVGRAEVARLAEALGIDGAPVADGQTWRVGQGKDGQGPMLQVNRKAPGAWTFSRYAPGSDNCASGKPVCPQTSGSASADPVSADAAKKAAAPVLKAVGQGGAAVDASQLMGARRVVNAEPQIGGLPSYGWTTGVIVSAQGEVVGGSGQLKAPVKGDTYPVVGAEEALAALNAGPGAEPQPRMGIGGCASPVPLKDRLEQPCGASASAPARETLKVEDATFGLAMRYADGGQALVPSWLFEVRAPGAKDAFTVTYPAVEPRYLSAPSGTPTEQPSPRPTGPGDEPTAAPATRDVPVDGYTADGRELTVAFTGGVCADYRVTTDQNSDRVTVTVTETPWPDKVCIEIAKVFHKTVQLDEPLGARKVVGRDGRGVPLEKPGARLPAESGQPR